MHVFCGHHFQTRSGSHQHTYPVSSGRSLKLTTVLMLALRPLEPGFLPLSIFLHFHGVVIKGRDNSNFIFTWHIPQWNHNVLCLQISCFAYCSDLKVEALCTSAGLRDDKSQQAELSIRSVIFLFPVYFNKGRGNIVLKGNWPYILQNLQLQKQPALRHPVLDCQWFHPYKQAGLCPCHTESQPQSVDQNQLLKMVATPI